MMMMMVVLSRDVCCVVCAVQLLVGLDCTTGNLLRERKVRERIRREGERREARGRETTEREREKSDTRIPESTAPNWSKSHYCLVRGGWDGMGIAYIPCRQRLVWFELFKWFKWLMWLM